MRVQLLRVLLVLTCLVFGVVGVSSPAAAADKKKTWPSKKHHKTHHKGARPAKATTGAAKPGAAPAEDADEEDGDESADDERDDKAGKNAKGDDAKPHKAKASNDDDEREPSDAKGKGDDEDGEGDAPVVRHKSRKPVVTDEDGAAPVALALEAGPRIVHRSFSFNDPLSNYNGAAAKPYSYSLPAGPAPFVDLALYPAAFATRGFAANIGLVASYERLIGTKTQAADGTSFSTLGQQLEVGARVRVPVGEHEVGAAVTYGKHTFHVSENDPGPAAGSSLPNVDYSFAGVGLDARLRFSPVEFGAHVGTRFVYNTGSLAKNWFPTTKTTSVDAGVFLGYHVTPLLEIVAGGDFLRYAFDFNPVPQMNALVAGGAVDQYISGYLALRVSISGG